MPTSKPILFNKGSIFNSKKHLRQKFKSPVNNTLNPFQYNRESHFSGVQDNYSPRYIFLGVQHNPTVRTI